MPIGRVIILPTAVKVVNNTKCSDEDCDPLMAPRPEILPSITPTPWIRMKHLELRKETTAKRSSRGQQHVRSYLHGGFSNTNTELGSTSSDGVPTKSIGGSPCSEIFMKDFCTDFFLKSVVVPTLSPNRSAPLQTLIEGTSENKSVEDEEPHHISSFLGSRSQRVRPVLVPRQDDGYQSSVLDEPASPTTSSAQSVAVASVIAYGPFTESTSSSAASSTALSSGGSLSTAAPPTTIRATDICPAGNGTTYASSSGIKYEIICNTDYFNNNLEFDLVYSFEGCVQKCDAWNYNHHQVQCVAALFLPNREVDVDDCYLKSKLVATSTPSEAIEGAIRLGFENSVSSQPSTSLRSTATRTSQRIISSSASSPVTPIASSSGTTSPGVTYGSGDSVIVPKVGSSHLQGATQNTPTKQYLDIDPPSGINLAQSLLTVGVNGDLTTGYDISGQTGILEVNISTQSHLSPLKNTPHLSRDGGRGGMINGEHLFVFCDTGSYTTTTSTENGDFLGFVSSSVAIDAGMKGLTGGPLNLEDGIGQWSDNAGRMRGFAPLTEGEVAYNQVMQGPGQRYAVWPESEIIPLDSTTGIMYAPIVYDNVNKVTKAAVFTYTGVTLLTITAGGKGGPFAERTVEKIFQQNEVEWGCAGGIRSWGPSGIGGDDGKVYVFGNVEGGILLGRTPPGKFADVASVSNPS